METTYKVRFHYDNPALEKANALRQLVESEYMRLRNIACDELNPHYDKWNEEFGDNEVDEHDELKDFGGTKYCNFIRRKQDDILKKINKREATFVRLYSTEVCDIGGMLMNGKNILSKFYITIIPVTK